MRILTLAILVFLSACSNKGEKVSSRGNASETTNNYFKSATELTVQVAYETGAEPYVSDERTPGVSIWWLLEENLNALFQGRANAPSITVPKRLNQFTELPASGKTAWTVEDILKLAKTHRVGQSSATQSYFWIVFLNGHFHNGSNLQTSTIGLSIQGTTVLAVFKDVIRNTSTGGPFNLVAKYVEQSTLVHEMGHALGLVNNGLPVKSAHEDTGHKAHCSNPDCVMFWSNEGASDMAAYVQQIITKNSVIMYDDACLKDSREY